MKKRADNPFLLARREGWKAGALQGIWITLAIAVIAFVGLHTALTMRADAIHESAQATIREADAILLRDCRADVARYNDIAQLERDAVAAMEGRR